MPTSLELIKKIRQWLDDEGYPFELQVGRHLASLGWHVAHEHIYKDLDTEKPRACDIFAIETQYILGPEDRCSVAMAVECKSTTNKPWVVFLSQQSYSPEMAVLVSSTGIMGYLALEVIADRRAEFLHLLLQDSQPLGHGVVQSFTDRRQDEQNPAYTAGRAAIAAAGALSRANDIFYLEASEPPRNLQVVIPVVVLEGALIACSLAEDGSTVLEETDIARVLLASANRPGTPVPVYIVTERGLDALAGGLRAEMRKLAGVLKETPELHSRVKRRVKELQGPRHTWDVTQRPYP